MEKVFEPIEKKKQPKKKEAVKEERKIVDSPLSRLWGLCKGQVFYESDDIFYAYKFN